MGLPPPKKFYTPHEYYELERNAEYKSDYYRGEIFAMAGGTPRHSLISANISGEARSLLKGSSCRVYESNLRVKSKVTGLRHYPDAAVYCGPLEYDDEDPDRQTILNPTVVFEVLSPSTEGYDRGFKSENYRGIESLKAYVLVSQNKPHLEILERQSNGVWLLREERGLDAILGIPAIGINLPLAGVYAGVDFAGPATPSGQQTGFEFPS